MPKTTAAPLPNIPCVILAGGQSRRFGSDKARAVLRGERLIDVLIQGLEAQTSGPVAINAKSDYELKDRLILSDRIEGGVGPLAGIHAAICWAHESGFDAVITTAVDTPILPADFISKLLELRAPSVAACRDRTHAIHGLWPVELRTGLENAIRDGMRAARDWAELSKARRCVFTAETQIDPFFNVNTSEDLNALNKVQPVSPR